MDVSRLEAFSIPRQLPALVYRRKLLSLREEYKACVRLIKNRMYSRAYRLPALANIRLSVSFLASSSKLARERSSSHLRRSAAMGHCLQSHSFTVAASAGNTSLSSINHRSRSVSAFCEYCQMLGYLAI